MRIYKVILTEYERGCNSNVFDELYFKKEENALSYIKEYNYKNDLSTTPQYYTKAEYIGVNIVPDNFKLEDVETKEVIEFECVNSNYGSQVLVFNNDEIDVILRNQNIRNHNSDKKEDIKYRINIERL